MKRSIFGLALASALLLAAPASGKIIEWHSIAGVTLGDTQTQVRAKLGRPKEIMRCGKGCMTWKYDAPLSGVLSFKGGKVDGMWTASKKQKTRKGIRPGSNEEAVRKAYPSVRCGAGVFGPGSRMCTIQGRYRGRAVLVQIPFNAGERGAREIGIYVALGQ